MTLSNTSPNGPPREVAKDDSYAKPKEHCKHSVICSNIQFVALNKHYWQKKIVSISEYPTIVYKFIKRDKTEYKCHGMVTSLKSLEK